MVSYQHPEFFVGDYVIIKAAKDKQEEGFIVDMFPKRNEQKEFVEWIFKVARINNDTVTEHSAKELRGKMSVMRQYARSTW